MTDQNAQRRAMAGILREIANIAEADIEEAIRRLRQEVMCNTLPIADDPKKQGAIVMLFGPNGTTIASASGNEDANAWLQRLGKLMECDGPLRHPFIDPEEEDQTHRRRPETGVVQFHGDWPGIFIRGDDAHRSALWLQTAQSSDAGKQEAAKKHIDSLIRLMRRANMMMPDFHTESVQNAMLTDLGDEDAT